MVYGLFVRNFLRILPLSVERFRLVCRLVHFGDVFPQRFAVAFLSCYIFFLVNCFKFHVWLVERVARVIVANHRPTCSIPSIIPVCNWKQSLVLVDTRFSLTETSVVRLIKDSSYMKSYSCYEVNSLCKRYRNHWSNKKSNRFCQCCSGVMLGIKIILNLLVKTHTACN